MNKGLYCCPGFLATAWLAACASSLFLPIIKVSKVYLGFRPELPELAGACRGAGAPLEDLAAGLAEEEAAATGVPPNWYLISLISGASVFSALSISWWYLLAIQSREKALGTPTKIKSSPRCRMPVFLNQVLKLALLRETS